MNIFKRKVLVAIFLGLFSSVLIFAYFPRTAAAQTFAFLFWGNKTPTIKVTPTLAQKKVSTVGWDRQHRVFTAGAATTPIALEMNPNSPGKEIAFIDADRILYVYGADGTLLATSSAKVTQQYGQPPNFTLSAIDLNGDRDTQGNTEYDLVLPATTSNTPNTTSVYLQAFKLAFVGGSYKLEATSSASVASKGAPFSAAAVDDLENDGRPEVFVTTKKTTGEASLLGWTWEPQTRTFVPLNNGVDSGPVIMTMTTNVLSSVTDGLLEPAIGSVATNDGTKQIVVAGQTPGFAIQIYVFRKNGLTLTPFSSQTSAPYYWYQEQINETPPGAPGIERTRIGGISLADLNGDGRFEVVATTKKRQTGVLNRSGYYDVRVFKHDVALGGGVRLAEKLETAFGIMDDGSSSNSTISRPTIGSFEGHTPAISFFNTENSKGLFSAFYNGTTLEWVNNYSPRFTNDYLYQQGLPITCAINNQVMGGQITLDDTDNNGRNELIYLKYDVSNGSTNYNYVRLLNAEGPAVPFPECASTPVEFVDVHAFASFSPATVGWLIRSYSNVEIADIDGDNAVEAIVTYNNAGNGNDGVKVVPIAPVLSTLPSEWPMTGASACRQGRMGATCPSTSFTPLTPTPTPSTPFASCTGIKYYKVTGDITNPLYWVLIPKTSILPGDTIYATCTHTVSNGTVDMARFRVNGSSWTVADNNHKKPGSDEYYFPYVFPTGGTVTNFTFEAEVHVPENNQWY